MRLSPVFFCEHIYMKAFFHCFIHASLRSQMFYNIDVLEIFLKIHKKMPVPDSLDSGTCFPEKFLKIFRNTFFTEHL